MSPKLTPGQRCPIHGGVMCCGRTDTFKRQGKYPKKFGVTYLPDGREKCSPAAKRKRKDQLLKQHPYCAACGEKFTDYRDVELAHRTPKGMNGGKVDDSWSNLVLMHMAENRQQGSRSLNDYLAWRREKGLQTP